MEVFRIIICFSLILFSACSHQEGEVKSPSSKQSILSEQEIRMLFIDSTENNPFYWDGIFEFIQTYYPAIDISGLTNAEVQTLYTLEEEFLSKNNIDNSKQIIRLTFIPAFTEPYSIMIELKNGKSYLTTKIANGPSGYHCSHLKNSLTQVSSDSLFNYYLNELHNLNFWHISEDTMCYGYDGVHILFEATDQGKFARTTRWSPLLCKDSTTVNLGKIAESLKKNGLIENDQLDQKK